MRIGHAIAIAALAVATMPAHAEPFRHEASGLAINPPPGYVLKALPGRGQNAVRVEAKKPDDKDTGCQVGFADAPQNAGLKQSAINAQMRKKEHQDLAKVSIAALYETQSVEAFDASDVTGLAIVANFKPREGVPARAQEIETLMILLETPKGRTSVVCVADKANFVARRPEFEALARGATLPK